MRFVSCEMYPGYVLLDVEVVVSTSFLNSLIPAPSSDRVSAVAAASRLSRNSESVGMVAAASTAIKTAATATSIKVNPARRAPRVRGIVKVLVPYMQKATRRSLIDDGESGA